MSTNSFTKGTPARQLGGAWLSLVEQQVSTLNFGSVLITVHEGRVVQIETNEKFRLDRGEPVNGSVQNKETGASS